MCVESSRWVILAHNVGNHHHNISKSVWRPLRPELFPGEGAAALRLDKLTSSNSMFSYVLSYNYLITAIYRSKQIDGFLLCILYSGLISPNPPRFKFPRFSSLSSVSSCLASCFANRLPFRRKSGSYKVLY